MDTRGADQNGGAGVDSGNQTDRRPMNRASTLAAAAILIVAGACTPSSRGPEDAEAQSIEELSAKAEQGDAEAQYLLGEAYYFGQGVEEDLEEGVDRWTKAVDRWTKAAEQGHADAQYRLGEAYYFGQGVEQDPEEAVDWWTKAAEQGHAEAQYELGEAYHFGEGVEQDHAEAVRWWTKAADQGHADAGEILAGLAKL